MTHRRPMAGRRPRAARRAAAREQTELVRDLEKLARLERGGAPERPFPIESVAQVDVMATSHPCPLCEGAVRLVEHAAETVDGVRLRVARIACTLCGVQRARYFRLDEPALH
jgi:hypothetical protein